MKALLIPLAFFLLTGCSDATPTATFSMEDCHLIGKYETRTRRVSTGACLVWAKIGSTRTCTMYQQRAVHESKFDLICSRNEWRETVPGVE